MVKANEAPPEALRAIHPQEENFVLPEAVAAVAHRIAQGAARPAGGSGNEGWGRRAASDRHASGTPGVDAVIAVSASSGAYDLLLAIDPCCPLVNRCN